MSTELSFSSSDLESVEALFAGSFALGRTRPLGTIEELMQPGVIPVRMKLLEGAIGYLYGSDGVALVYCCGHSTQTASQRPGHPLLAFVGTAPAAPPKRPAAKE